MNVRHNILAPVNVLGHPSSGTSLLVRLLRTYYRIAFGTESQFIVRFYRRLHWYGDLSEETSLRRLIDDIVQERWFQRCHERLGWRVDPEGVFRDVQEPSYRGVLESIFRQLARFQGMQRWGDKSPNDIYQCDVFLELFPEAKFIHIIRDGRDVALSLFGRPFGRKNIYLAARDWRRMIDHVDRFAGRLPAGQFCEIRYEELLANPVDTFERLREFLGIADRDGRLREHVADHLPREIRRANCDKWRRAWGEEKRRRYERIAGDVLSRHGYETMINGSPNSVTPFKTSYWTVIDKLHKYRFLGYWQDNLYKAGLRSRDALRAVRCVVESRRDRRRNRLSPDRY